jgi:hypothetical protein
VSGESVTARPAGPIDPVASGWPVCGRTVLVTGASRGIGAATARALHRNGANVVAHCGRDSDAQQRRADELGEQVQLVHGDLTLRRAAGRICGQAMEVTSRLDVLVNNADAWLSSRFYDDVMWGSGWLADIALTWWPRRTCAAWPRCNFSTSEAASSSTSSAGRLIAGTTPNTWHTVQPWAASRPLPRASLETEKLHTQLPPTGWRRTAGCRALARVGQARPALSNLK